MEALTERQLAILRFIAAQTETQGFPPTIREIGLHFQIKSTNGVNDHLKALERKGYLQRTGRLSRSLLPTPRARTLLGLESLDKADTSTVSIPLVGRVAAGIPLLAEQNLDDMITLDATLLPKAETDVFALRVKGDSMINDGIFNGDYVFVRRQKSARPGDIAVAMIDGEATVKRFYPEGDRIRLQPANDAMQPIYVESSAMRDFSLLGVVLGLYRKFS